MEGGRSTERTLRAPLPAFIPRPCRIATFEAALLHGMRRLRSNLLHGHGLELVPRSHGRRRLAKHSVSGGVGHGKPKRPCDRLPPARFADGVEGAQRVGHGVSQHVGGAPARRPPRPLARVLRPRPRSLAQCGLHHGVFAVGTARAGWGGLNVSPGHGLILAEVVQERGRSLIALRVEQLCQRCAPALRSKEGEWVHQTKGQPASRGRRGGGRSALCPTGRGRRLAQGAPAPCGGGRCGQPSGGTPTPAHPQRRARRQGRRGPSREGHERSRACFGRRKAALTPLVGPRRRHTRAQSVCPATGGRGGGRA